MSKLNEATIANIKEVGHEWHFKNMNRMYLNLEDIIDVEFYNSGNVNHAYLNNGEKISNSKANGLRFAKTYLDLDTGELVSDSAILFDEALAKFTVEEPEEDENMEEEQMTEETLVEQLNAENVSVDDVDDELDTLNEVDFIKTGRFMLTDEYLDNLDDDTDFEDDYYNNFNPDEKFVWESNADDANRKIVTSNKLSNLVDEVVGLDEVVRIMNERNED
ncbi:hypothetical protein OXT66_03350 [Lentilactobacillus senioris]|uniref:hypothetical protein n=1 Tax=Lentilactobacillus senioris TaxID=931534 RepID=UPI00227FB8D7|nr:hypothetical protein [Lentilactobacillus senioris]MCY9806586.1 hypothetical protein [Lentilactobacillus senioris]